MSKSATANERESHRSGGGGGLSLGPRRLRSRTTLGANELFLDAEERYEVLAVKAAERPHLLLRRRSPPPPPASSSSSRPPVVGAPDGDGDAAASVCESASRAFRPHSDEKKCDGEEERRTKGAEEGSDDDGAADDDSDSDSSAPPPLIDGCDVPAWRSEGLIGPISDEVRGALHVGGGREFFRRESQLPVGAVVVVGGARGGGSGDEGGEGGGGGDVGSAWDDLRSKLRHPVPPGRDAIVLDYDEFVTSVPLDDEDEDEGPCRRTATRFALEFEERNVPAKILGAARGWKAMPDALEGMGETLREQEGPEFKLFVEGSFALAGGDDEGDGSCDVGGWTFQNLLRRFSNVRWRFSDNHGEMMTLGTYAKYITNLEGLTDDSPLAVYDAEFGDDDSPTRVLLEEYRVPKCFSDDLFDLAAEDEWSGDEGDDDRAGEEDDDDDGANRRRPPHRWILIGPPRSGTGMHVDPLYTNAWVTILQGRKRWMLFPPATPPAELGMDDGRPQIPSSIWFRDYYDVVTGRDWPDEWEPVEVLQEPGETVFVPNGWPHVVLNLELTVAVTHNYASEYGPFERMWEEVAEEEPEFAVRWLKGMEVHRPDLAERVRATAAAKDRQS